MLGALLVSLGLDSGQFRSGLTDAEKSFRATQKQFEQVGANMAKVGAGLSAFVTAPLIAGAAAAVSGFQDQQQAMAQVQASLSSMGAVAGRTAQQLSDAADGFEMHSLVDADAILKNVTANLLTYGNVTGTVFDRAQQAILDLSQKTGKGLLEATTMVGKALNDPAKGLSALSEVGIQFSASQQAAVKSMIATGNVAGAQGVILGELEHQFKGAAQAAADTSPWRQAQVAINQASDTIGEALLPVIPPIANAIRDVALAFANLSPGMQSFSIAAVAIAAAAGPVIGSFGAIITVSSGVVGALGKTAIALGATTTAEIAAIGAGYAFGAMLRTLLVATGVGTAIAAVGAAVYFAYQRMNEGTTASGAFATAQNTLRTTHQALEAATIKLATATGAERVAALAAAQAAREGAKQNLAKARTDLVAAQAALKHAQAEQAKARAMALQGAMIPTGGGFGMPDLAGIGAQDARARKSTRRAPI